MIDGVGKGGTGRIDLSRQEKGAAVSPLKSDGSRAPGGAVQSAVLELVAGGAPVDSARVEAVHEARRHDWHSSPDLKERLLSLAALAQAAQIRVNFLTDMIRRRVDAAAALRGAQPQMTYHPHSA
jgi:hypothetical protein